MIPRERVLNAIEHKEIDRFPRDLGGLVSSISKIAYQRLLNYWNLPSNNIITSNRVQQLAEISNPILEKLSIDTRHITPKVSNSDENISDSFTDIYGIKFQRTGSSEYPVLYYEMVSFPFSDANLNDVRKYKWPKPIDSWFSACMRDAKKYKKENYAIIADPVSGGIQEQTVWLRGIEKFFLDLYQNRDIIEELLDSVKDNQIEITEMYLEQLSDYVDIILYGDDYGNQDRLMMHPKMWRELIKPRVKEFVRNIKRNYPHIKILLHSCGSIHAIIPDLIEIGFDILNPVQPLAIGMDHQSLKDRYGKKICFHGGFDIQQVLPYGTPKENANEVKRLASTLGADGTGYIFAMAHNILADVPAENLISAYEALDQINNLNSE